jgi:hypothetical protein
MLHKALGREEDVIKVLLVIVDGHQIAGRRRKEGKAGVAWEELSS